MYVLLWECLCMERWRPFERKDEGQSLFIAHCVSEMHMQHTQCRGASHEAWDTPTTDVTYLHRHMHFLSHERPFPYKHLHTQHIFGPIV